MVYDCESSGRSIIFSIHNTLYFKGVNHNLVPTFMISLAGLKAYKFPKFLAHNPTISYDFILLPDLQIPLLLSVKGVLRGFIDFSGKYLSCNFFF